MSLPDIAAKVAKALGLEADDEYWLDTEHMALAYDGSNLFDPYWQVRCRDWLLARRYTLTFEPGDIGHDAYQRVAIVKQGPRLNCPASEFCARAIAKLMEKP